QADLLNRGSAALRELVRELESAQPLSLYLVPDPTPGDRTDDSGRELNFSTNPQYGRAVRYQRPVNYDLTDGYTYEMNGASARIFELYFERVSDNEFQLMRSVDGVVSPVLTGIRCRA